MQNIENELKTKSLALCSEETLNLIQKPVGAAIYKSVTQIPKKEKGKYNDKIECEICGKIYTRSNFSSHKKTSYHKIYNELNKKLAKILIKKI